MPKNTYTSVIGDALHNAAPYSGASDDYARGVFVGLVAAISTDNYTNGYMHALRELAFMWRPGYRAAAVPEAWREDFAACLRACGKSL